MKAEKQRVNKKTWLILFALLGILSFRTSHAAEEGPQQPTTVQISPVRFDWTLEDGEERNGQVNLKNYSDKPYSVKVQIEDFYVKDDSSVAEFFVPDANHPLRAYDVINWVSISDKDLVLAPGESRNMIFTVKVPQGTPTGGYYGVVFFQYQEKKEGETPDQAASKIQINTRSGALLTMAVKGEEPLSEDGILKKFKTSKKLYWDNPVTFLSEITNSGNIHYKMDGNIEVNRFGKKMGDVKVDSRLYYPKKVRPLENVWNFGFFDIGYYTAKMNLASEDGNVVVVGKTSFIVIPWKLMAVIAGIIFFLWLIFKLGGRKERKKITRKAA